MDNNLHNIDKIFAKTLGDHSIDPPASVWDNIKSEMDAAAGQNIDQTFAAALGTYTIEPATSVWDKIQGQLDAPASTHEIDEVFEKGLGQHTMEPASYVWNNIKGTLDLAVGKRRRIIGWFFGTASAVVIAFIGGYFIANTGGSSDNTISDKITNIHQVQINVNHLLDLRNVTTPDVTNTTNTGGGHSNMNNTPNDNTVNGNNNSNTNNGFDNRNANVNTNNHTIIEDSKDIRNTPNIINNDQHNPGDPAKNQNSGGEDDGKKTNAVTADVNGPVENQIGMNGSTIVTAINNNNQVVIENSTNNTIVNDNNSNTNNTVNTSIEENHTETVNPNLDEKGNPLTVKGDHPTTFTILPYFEPTYTFRNSSMTSNNGIQDAFDSLNGNSKFSEKANFSYSTGLLVGYSFTKNLTVFIGASFNSFSNTTNRNNVHTKSFDQLPPSDTSTNMLTTAGELEGVNIIPGTPGSLEDATKILQDNMVGTVNTITQTFSYVEVPVLVRYKIGGPKIGLILTGGISTGFIVQNDVQLAGDNETKSFGQTASIRNFNMNASIGIGIEARLLPFMYLNIEPTFKYSFINWSMDGRFQMNPISLGLRTGLAFKF